MVKDIKVPSVGESVTEVTIAKWLKADGDYVVLTLTGGAGESYIVEHSPDLQDWEPIVTVTLPDSDPAVWEHAIKVTGPVGFFRVLVD